MRELEVRVSGRKGQAGLLRFWAVPLALLTGLSYGQRLDVAHLQALALPANVVPQASTFTGQATVKLWVFLVRDASGQVLSGAVDYVNTGAAMGGTTFTAIRIHRGAAGQNGPQVAELSLVNTIGSPSAPGAFSFGFSPVQIGPGEQLTALERMVASPGEFYLNLTTEAQPDGAMRGQLQTAEETVLMALLTPEQVVPPVTGLDLLAAQVLQFYTTRDVSGALTSVYLQSVSTNVSGEGPLAPHVLRRGVAGTNGPPVWNPGNFVRNLPRPGLSVIAPRALPIPGPPGQLDAVDALLRDPTSFHVLLGDAPHPDGFLRGQLRFTDKMRLQLNLQSSNVVPAVPGLMAGGAAVVEVNALRGEDGAIIAGAVEFFTNVRFPGAAELTRMSIRQGAVGTNGPESISIFEFPGTPPPLYRHASSSGLQIPNTPVVFGPRDRDLVSAVNQLVNSPDNFHLQIGTSANPSGALRAQMGPASRTPVIHAVVSATLDPGSTTAAPGGLITIFGSDLAKVASGLRGWQGSLLPTSLNNAVVEVGLRRAPLLYVSSNQINAQVPFEVAAGTQPVAVHNGATPSEARMISVNPVAPSLFFTERGGVILKAADSSLVGPDNPASAGDILRIYSTGLGQTAPPLSTGRIVPAGTAFQPAAVTATIGGQPAEVLQSAAAPGWPGVYETRLRMPPGVAPGTQPIVLRIGGAVSNAVRVSVR
jgi:uncharacterized protein (TIGR03437 family)